MPVRNRSFVTRRVTATLLWEFPSLDIRLICRTNLNSKREAIADGRGRPSYRQNAPFAVITLRVMLCDSTGSALPGRTLCGRCKLVKNRKVVTQGVTATSGPATKGERLDVSPPCPALPRS